MGGSRSYMKIVFFGTPDYVVPVLEKLSRAYNKPNQERQLIAVVTQPPSPVGREKKIERSAVDNWAYKHKVDVLFEFDDIQEADLGIVAAYGKIIPQEVLDKFSHGLINLHFSLLPDLRGASPVHASIILGKEKAGVTFFKLDEKMDHGLIISQFSEYIETNDTVEALRHRLSARSAEVLETLIPAYISGKINLKSQDHEKATYSRVITKEHGFVPPKSLSAALKGKQITEPWDIGFISGYEITGSAETIERFIRAMNPWPSAWTLIKINDQELRLKLLKAHIDYKKLVLDEVQLEGKNPVIWEQFQEGYKEATF